MAKQQRDSDGRLVGAGGTIAFSYGIPPVPVLAHVIERNGKLIALTPGHKPNECHVEKLKRYVCDFWIVDRSKRGSGND